MEEYNKGNMKPEGMVESIKAARSEPLEKLEKGVSLQDFISRRVNRHIVVLHV